MNRKHGRHTTPEYRSWHSAKARCLYPSMPSYRWYGGRGITMCQSWSDSFETFFADMGPRPNGTTLDRIDHNGDYEPGNCRWATLKEQAREERGRGHKLHADQVAEIRAIGRNQTLRRIGAAYGVSHTTVRLILEGRCWA